MQPKSRVWMFFVALAGLCWGVYVPLIAEGGKELHSPFAAFLCVGAAYFLLAVLLPILILAVRGKKPAWNGRGVTFATLAGVAGAVGALCVVFATVVFRGPPLFVAPVIFALAPVINTIVSLFWHPDEGAVHASACRANRSTGRCTSASSWPASAPAWCCSPRHCPRPRRQGDRGARTTPS